LFQELYKHFFIFGSGVIPYLLMKSHSSDYSIIPVFDIIHIIHKICINVPAIGILELKCLIQIKMVKIPTSKHSNWFGGLLKTVDILIVVAAL
jgi:hypothetical protein